MVKPVRVLGFVEDLLEKGKESATKVGLGVVSLSISGDGISVVMSDSWA